MDISALTKSQIISALKAYIKKNPEIKGYVIARNVGVSGYIISALLNGYNFRMRLETRIKFTTFFGTHNDSNPANIDSEPVHA